MVGADTINTILASMDSKLTSDDINIETLGDGTVDVDVKNDTYTINLNHTHEGMAKLVVDTAANLPDASEMESDTIYGELDDGEIATIYLGGYPFYGGGGGASSGPVLRRPADGATIDMGQTTSGTVSKTINVKGKSLTQALTIQLTGTGYSFGTTQPSGVTRDSSTQLTVTTAAANALNGVDIVVVYTGSDTDEDASGTLGITSASPDSISTEATLVANKLTYENLAAVKFTNTQWINTGISVGPSTSMQLDIEFLNTFGPMTATPTFLSTSNRGFAFNVAGPDNGLPARPEKMFFWIQGVKVEHDYSSGLYARGIISYSPGNISFLGFSSTTETKTTTSTNLAIGYGWNKTDPIFNYQHFLVYGIKFYEGGTLTHDFKPYKRNGVVGLLDTETGTFISSQTSSPLVPVNS